MVTVLELLAMVSGRLVNVLGLQFVYLVIVLGFLVSVRETGDWVRASGSSVRFSDYSEHAFCDSVGASDDSLRDSGDTVSVEYIIR